MPRMDIFLDCRFCHFKNFLYICINMKTDKIIIAIAGDKGSGKDTIATMIEYIMSVGTAKANFREWYNRYTIAENLNNNIIHFADRLKEICSQITNLPIHYFNNSNYKDGWWWIYGTNSFIGDEDIEKNLKLIKDYSIKCGLSVCPDTKVSSLIPYLPYLDQILVMSVVPGKGGQSFIEETEEKIKEVRKLIESYNLDIVVNEAKATNVNGYVDLTITNKTNVDIEEAYLKVNLISKSQVLAITKYMDIQYLKAGESRNYKLNFEGKYIKTYIVTVTDEFPDKENIISIFGYEINTADIFGMDFSEYINAESISSFGKSIWNSFTVTVENIPWWGWFMAWIIIAGVW